MISGIYCIENIINNKKYIGQSKDIWERITEHRRMLNNNIHYNNYLQSAWNKYGKENFIFYIIDECSDINKLNELEIFYILELKTKSHQNGYNLTDGGEGKKNFVCTDETREKLSIGHMGEKHHMFGKHMSQETKDKISKSKSGSNHHMFGKHLEQYIIDKIKEKRKGENNLTGTVRKKLNSNSKYFGVSKCTMKNKSGKIYVYWKSCLNYNKKRFYLGQYKNEIDAAKAFDKKSWEVYHDLSKLNFPEDYEVK